MVVWTQVDRSRLPEVNLRRNKEQTMQILPFKQNNVLARETTLMWWLASLLQLGLLFKERICSQWEQILSFKGRHILEEMCHTGTLKGVAWVAALGQRGLLLFFWFWKMEACYFALACCRFKLAGDSWASFFSDNKIFLKFWRGEITSISASARVLINQWEHSFKRKSYFQREKNNSVLKYILKVPYNRY